MAKSRYPWGLMLMMYIKGNYTTTDLHYIFGAVPGHISKRFAEKNVDTRSRGKKTMQISPRAFPAELNKRIRQEENYENLVKRIDVYYKNVCLPLKAVEILRLKERGLSNAEISKRYAHLSERSVGRVLTQFKGESSQSLKSRVDATKQKFEGTLPKIKTGS